MDREFLKDVQTAGWQIVTVTESSVIARCPCAFCGITVSLQPGGVIPKVGSGLQMEQVQDVQSYDDIRRALRTRRETLGLSIKDVEAIIGQATDMIAKYEKDDPTNTPPYDFISIWALALGLGLSLKSVGLSNLALRTIADTRDKYDSRSRRFHTLNRRRQVGRR